MEKRDSVDRKIKLINANSRIMITQTLGELFGLVGKRGILIVHVYSTNHHHGNLALNDAATSTETQRIENKVD